MKTSTTKSAGESGEPTGKPTSEPTRAHESSRSWRPATFIERIGAALTAPRRALAAADEPEASGTAGNDLAWLIGLVFVATYTREVVSSLWIAGSESIMAGLQGLAGALSRAIAMDLVVLFMGGFALTILAGRKRAMGRDFDLACVAFIPVIIVRLIAEFAVKLFSVRLPDSWESALAVVAYGWAGCLFLLAWWTARARSADDADSAPESGGDA